MKSMINQIKYRCWSKNVFKACVTRSQSIKIYNQNIDHLRICEGRTNVFLNNIVFIQISEYLFLKYNEVSWQVYLAYALFV